MFDLSGTPDRKQIDLNYLIRLHNETLGLKYWTITLPVGAVFDNNFVIIFQV